MEQADDQTASSAASGQIITDGSSLAELAASSSSSRGIQTGSAPSRHLRRVNTAGASVPGSQETQQGSQDEDLARRTSGLMIATQDSAVAIPVPESQESAFSFGAAANGSQDSELAQRPQNLDISSSQPSDAQVSNNAGLPSPSSVPQSRRFYCPVPGCPANDTTRHPGWGTKKPCLEHVNLHMLGAGMPGLPPTEWMQAEQLMSCRRCSKLVSMRVGNGMHST